jgi:hypothetical protein
MKHKATAFRMYSSYKTTLIGIKRKSKIDHSENINLMHAFLPSYKSDATNEL